MINKKPELLAPAGSLDKLKMAILYGADAVYLGGVEFSMRTASKNFNDDELLEGINYAHENGAKVYVAINIVPRSEEIERLPEYLKKLSKFKADGVILTDLGVMECVKKYAPDLEIHISTQANITNYQTANAFYKMGARRIVLARELTLEEIKEIRQNIPEDMEIECFIHGAMCMSYSGRCLLSNYLTGRHSNKGNCAHPCRWKYALVEEKRPGEYMPVYEGEEGSYIFNSKDLCMIEYIPQLVEAGISSFKIEGRVKTGFYVANVVSAYRKAIDNYFDNRDNYKFDKKILDELKKVSHRSYCTGFFFGSHPTENQRYDSSNYIRDYEVVATVGKFDQENNKFRCKVKNKFLLGDTVEISTPKGDVEEFRIDSILDEKNQVVEMANHPETEVFLNLPDCAMEYSFIRKKKD